VQVAVEEPLEDQEKLKVLAAQAVAVLDILIQTMEVQELLILVEVAVAEHILPALVVQA
jgi:hypothetical protein